MFLRTENTSKNKNKGLNGTSGFSGCAPIETCRNYMQSSLVQTVWLIIILNFFLLLYRSQFFFLVGFFVISVLTIFEWYSCRDLVRRSSTEPCINWQRLSREEKGTFTNSICPTATRMDFTTVNRYVLFSCLLTAVLRVVWHSPFIALCSPAHKFAAAGKCRENRDTL